MFPDDSLSGKMIRYVSIFFVEENASYCVVNFSYNRVRSPEHTNQNTSTTNADNILFRNALGPKLHKIS